MVIPVDFSGLPMIEGLTPNIGIPIGDKDIFGIGKCWGEGLNFVLFNKDRGIDIGSFLFKLIAQTQKNQKVMMMKNWNFIFQLFFFFWKDFFAPFQKKKIAEYIFFLSPKSD